MTSIFLENIQRYFGEEFTSDPFVKEALTKTFGNNLPLAEVGDCVLSLVVKNLAYQKKGDTKFLNDMVEKYAKNTKNQEYLNSDIEFSNFLCDNYTGSPVGNIGKDIADAFYEALIGAVFIQHGFKAAQKYVINILNTDPNFKKEFSEYIDSRLCQECNKKYSIDDWEVREIGSFSWMLSCPEGHEIELDREKRLHLDK